jgi:hypothetical protein
MITGASSNFRNPVKFDFFQFFSSWFLVLSFQFQYIRRNGYGFSIQVVAGDRFCAGRGEWDRGLFGNRSGAQKKDAAMSFVSAALQVSDAVTSRHIIDEDKFKLGLSNVIDGVVLCLNASTWSKPAQP